MVRAARALAPFLVASALAACLSYPELETVEARDASVMPERPAQPIARTEDAGDAGTAARAPEAVAAADPSHPDEDTPPPPPPPSETKPCDECPPGTRCCTKGGKGKGKGKGKDEGDDEQIVCKPAQAECD